MSEGKITIDDIIEAYKVYCKVMKKEGYISKRAHNKVWSVS